MCREHKTTVQLLLMQVFLQVFLNSIFTAVSAKPQKPRLNKEIMGSYGLFKNGP